MVAPIEGQRIERDERRGRGFRELRSTRRGGMQASHQCSEVEFAVAPDDELAVEDQRGYGEGLNGGDDFREVTREWALVPASEVHALSVPKGETSEAVPLRLEHPAVTQR